MSKAGTGHTDSTVSVPDFYGASPVNYDDIRESFALAMKNDGADQDTIDAVIQTVDDAVVQNEHHLEWETDTPPNSPPAASGGLCPMTSFTVQNVPQEAVDYAFDQIGKGGIDMLLHDYVDWGLSGEISLDYASQTLTISSRTVVEQAIQKAIDEKLAGIQYEVEHGERDDYDMEDIRYARHALQFDISRPRA